VFPSPIPVGARLQQLAIADLVSFAALVIERPEEFVDRRIALASDELTALQAAPALAKVVGSGFVAEQTPAGSLGPGLRALFAWLEHAGNDVDIELCPRDHACAGVS
jgi:hypothetical protein